MTTRSSHNWHDKPGSFDALHTDYTFANDGNPYHIPTVLHAPLSYTPQWLAPYRARIRTRQGMAGGAVHFFLDDYRFESVWTRPHKAHSYLSRFRTLLTPDFSVYPEWPRAAQVWNTYRARWCGMYWASLGFQVIPTVSWADAASFEFCFAGIVPHSLVAVSSVGIRGASSALFSSGFREMLARLRPSRVLCYGKLTPELADLVDVRCYETRWDTIMQERAERGR